MAGKFLTAKAACNDWKAQFREAEGKAAAKFDRTLTVEAKLAEAMARLGLIEGKVEELTQRLGDAKDRAETAEANAHATEDKAALAESDAREAEERRADAEARARNAEDRAKDAENRTQDAETRAQNAVEQYKRSSAFDREVEELGLDSYLQGFNHCKEKVAQIFELDDLDAMRPGGPNEEASDEDDAGSEPGPAEP